MMNRFPTVAQWPGVRSTPASKFLTPTGREKMTREIEEVRTQTYRAAPDDNFSVVVEHDEPTNTVVISKRYMGVARGSVSLDKDQWKAVCEMLGDHD